MSSTALWLISLATISFTPGISLAYRILLKPVADSASKIETPSSHCTPGLEILFSLSIIFTSFDSLLALSFFSSV